MKKRILFWAISLGFASLVTIVFLEMMLRFLPVCDPTRRLPVNDGNPILRFEPNRTFIWSQGWNFELVNEVHVNNFGFVNNHDYSSHNANPVFAIIGDSYVQAIMVPFPETVMGRLQRDVGDDADIYSFGVSGSPLSQYLAYADYVREHFNPRALAVAIIGNDFDESLYKYKQAPGYHYFDQAQNGELGITRVDYAPGVFKDVIRQSALGRYLGINLDLQRRFRSLTADTSKEREFNLYVGNTHSDSNPMRVQDSQDAVDAFLRLLPSRAGLEPDNIVLIVDGRRPHLYDPQTLELTNKSFFSIMRTYLMTRASGAGYEVIDMEPAFLDHFAQHRQRFEFLHDNHWNALGHEMVYRQLRTSQTFRAFLNDMFPHALGEGSLAEKAA